MLKSKLRGYNSTSSIVVGTELKNELHSYLASLLNKTLNTNMVMQYPRCLKAFGYRIQRAFSDPGKYKVTYETAKCYFNISGSLLKKLPDFSSEDQWLIVEFCVMVEEYKISPFAQQQVKTLFTISQKRIDEKLAELRKLGLH